MKGRILTLTAAAMSIVLLAFSVPLAISIWNGAASRALAEANAQIQYLGELIVTVDAAALDLAVKGINSGGQQVTVYLSDGSRLGNPADASKAVELAKTGRSLTAETNGGAEVLYAVTDRSNGISVIRSFVPDQVLRAGVVQSWLWLAVLALVLFLGGLLLAAKLAGTLLRPIEDLVRVSQRVAAGDLDARVEVSGPEEIRSLGQAHNELTRRIRVLLQEERERSADLSHRLRTPLTSLQLEIDSVKDAELAERLTERALALEDAVSHSIAQARLSGSGSEAGTESSAAEVIAERLRFWSPLAADTGRTVSSGELPAISLPVGPEEFAACIDAAFQNFFMHTPSGSSLEISMIAGAAEDLLLIRDDGPGLPGAGGREVLRRGVSGSGSTGLGLDIIARTAERTGGRLELADSPSGGAELRIIFGRSSSGP